MSEVMKDWDERLRDSTVAAPLPIEVGCNASYPVNEVGHRRTVFVFAQLGEWYLCRPLPWPEKLRGLYMDGPRGATLSFKAEELRREA
jgi:hypothetical protein